MKTTNYEMTIGTGERITDGRSQMIGNGTAGKATYTRMDTGNLGKGERARR